MRHIYCCEYKPSDLVVHRLAVTDEGEPMYGHITALVVRYGGVCNLEVTWADGTVSEQGEFQIRLVDEPVPDGAV